MKAELERISWMWKEEMKEYLKGKYLKGNGGIEIPFEGCAYCGIQIEISHYAIFPTHYLFDITLHTNESHVTIHNFKLMKEDMI
jgi:hypothetical protein